LSAAALTSLSQQTVFATPLSRTLPRIRLRTRQAPQLIDQKILVTIDSWSPNSKYPDGHFVRALGKVESKEAEQESLLLEYEGPYRPFGRAILDCLPKEGDTWKVPPKSADSLEWRDREDLRDLIVCSIDPPSECFSENLVGLLAEPGQTVRTLTTLYTLVHCPMAISKLVSVSEAGFDVTVRKR
jgi:exosome complex exonuclease DIS3/RRP44